MRFIDLVALYLWSVFGAWAARDFFGITEKKFYWFIFTPILNTAMIFTLWISFFIICGEEEISKVEREIRELEIEKNYK
jgi:uncharacterized membrane protein